jgi:hypothetical protein
MAPVASHRTVIQRQSALYERNQPTGAELEVLISLCNQRTRLYNGECIILCLYYQTQPSMIRKPGQGQEFMSVAASSSVGLA